ncbi:class I SAM-dependent methyltransferase [Reyranella sp.]|uniref:class I SAM-dependent methyltransferase n=1 Tax=Reyranella sp. TaxID=1929291 RepID=UPI003D13E7D6
MTGPAGGDIVFAGSIPALYDRYLGPLLFAPYARELGERLADLKAGAVLETAAGTGIVTEVLVDKLPAGVEIVATDLNQAMVDHAAAKPALARAMLRQADALTLPFEAGRFDAVVCQFGAMFFPDRVAGYREARRVLKPGGRFLFAIWDSLDRNPMTRCVVDAMARRFPTDPPRFLARTPHGHSDRRTIRRELAEAGYGTVELNIVSLSSRADSPRDAAIGLCQGTPMRGEIEARATGPNGLQAATEAAAAALAAEYGNGPIEAPMQALVVVASG